MPPKKIKLVTKEKTLKEEVKEVKEVKDIKVDYDEIDSSFLEKSRAKNDDENPARKSSFLEKQDLENPARKISRAKKQDLLNPARKINDENKIVKEETKEDTKESVKEKETVKEEEDEEEDDKEDVTVASEPIKQEPLKKTKESSQKTRETSQLKPSTETSFDMFGSNNIDYRETILNYDCSKNKTLPKLTKYEIALVIGKRAKQIEDGANANIKVMPGKNSIEIAEEELRQGVIPFYIKRPIGNSFELFKLADM